MMQLKTTAILLGNQADGSILQPSLLKNAEKANHTLRIKGVGGEQMKVNHVRH